MSFWAVVFIVLMILWLFGGAWSHWPPAGNPPVFGPIGAHFLAWCCVAILGYIVLTTPVIVR